MIQAIIIVLVLASADNIFHVHATRINDVQQTIIHYIIKTVCTHLGALCVQCPCLWLNLPRNT